MANLFPIFKEIDSLTTPDNANDLNEISNAAFGATHVIATDKGEYSDGAVDVNGLSSKVARDVAAAIQKLSEDKKLRHVFGKNVLHDISVCTGVIVTSHFTKGKFYGHGHHVQQEIAAHATFIAAQSLTV